MAPVGRQPSDRLRPAPHGLMTEEWPPSPPLTRRRQARHVAPAYRWLVVSLQTLAPGRLVFALVTRGVAASIASEGRLPYPRAGASMSALGSLADIVQHQRHVRFTPQSRHYSNEHQRPLSAISGHQDAKGNSLDPVRVGDAGRDRRRHMTRTDTLQTPKGRVWCLIWINA